MAKTVVVFVVVVVVVVVVFGHRNLSVVVPHGYDPIWRPSSNWCTCLSC